MVLQHAVLCWSFPHGNPVISVRLCFQQVSDFIETLLQSARTSRLSFFSIVQVRQTSPPNVCIFTRCSATIFLDRLTVSEWIQWSCPRCKSRALRWKCCTAGVVAMSLKGSRREPRRLVNATAQENIYILCPMVSSVQFWRMAHSWNTWKYSRLRCSKACRSSERPSAFDVQKEWWETAKPRNGDIFLCTCLQCKSDFVEHFHLLRFAQTIFMMFLLVLKSFGLFLFLSAGHWSMHRKHQSIRGQRLKSFTIFIMFSGNDKARGTWSCPSDISRPVVSRPVVKP